MEVPAHIENLSLHISDYGAVEVSFWNDAAKCAVSLRWGWGDQVQRYLKRKARTLSWLDSSAPKEFIWEMVVKLTGYVA